MTLPLHDAPGTTDAPAARRASDADREHAARVVHDAAGAGKLTLEETEQRLGAVYAARLRHELPPLLADLRDDPPASATSRLTPVSMWVHRIWAAATALAVTVIGWAGRHRVAAILLGVLAVGVAASLVVALVVLTGADGIPGDGEGPETMGH